MAQGDFVWCDLSTLRPDVTERFYADLFGWTYNQQSQPDGTAYTIARTRAGEAAALFPMPQKFRDMGLTSFWMPYFAVEDAASACQTAQEMGGKVEVGPLDWSGGARIALIRDPLGAGFTVYEGPALPTGAGPGHPIWRGLYVSDASAVRGFYEALFGWRIAAAPDSSGGYRVRTAAGQDVGELMELDEEIRGRFQFWVLHFAVPDLGAAERQVVAGGGEIVYRDASSLLVRDPDGAALFLRETGGSVASQTAAPVKWRTWLGVGAILAAVLFELNWVWGVLFLLWTLPALRSGETYFVERLNRRENPLLFWLLIAAWVGLSVYLILTDLPGLTP